ncbi:DUF1266 domain-containing protein [Candidatus Peregrinibacteria bacterium]|nr:MAG: DUF1266 domain-containing protein [Candidatus Peregrinibacteria bacterium]
MYGIPVKEYTPAQKWILASTAHLAEAWGDSFNHLGTYQPTPGNKDMTQGILNNAWEVTSKNDLLGVLNWLEHTGDRSAWERDDMLAWDLVRYIYLCGMGHTAGFLNEKESWELCFPIARLLQKKYSSWRSLGAKYIEGRTLWGGDKKDNKTLETACKTLFDDTSSLWYMDWRTPLNEEELVLKEVPIISKTYMFFLYVFVIMFSIAFVIGLFTVLSKL